MVVQRWRAEVSARQRQNQYGRLMAADIEQLATQIRGLHAAFDSSGWEPSPAEYACAIRILAAVDTRPLGEAIVQGMRPVTPSGSLAEDSRLGPAAVSCAVYFRRSADPSSMAGGQVQDSFLDLLRKITGSPGQGSVVVGRR
ncbi:hypothetical protein GCM10018780_85640 [Streptomyces lanatus]|nr:hypothetical protein GCM10018780_85640 [Streptomyces lanatus]